MQETRASCGSFVLSSRLGLKHLDRLVSNDSKSVLMLLLLSFTEKLIFISKNYCNNSVLQATFSTFNKLLTHHTLFNHFVRARLS